MEVVTSPKEANMKIEQLQPGSRFRYPYCGLTATLVRVGIGSAVVDIDRVKECDFVANDGTAEQKRVRFTKRVQRAVVSKESFVEPIQ